MHKTPKGTETNFSPSNFLDEENTLSKGFLHISTYSLLESIPEMLSEWWADTKKDLQTFLKDEGLSALFDEKLFVDVLVGKYYFSESMLLLLKEKIPYNISLETLYKHNKAFIRNHPKAQKLEIDDNLVIERVIQIRAQKKEKRQQRIRDWRSANKQKRAEVAARYRSLHREEIREKNRICDQKNKDRKAEYSRTHRKEIKERYRIRMEDEEYRRKIQEQRKIHYQKHAAEIIDRHKQKRLQNLEAAREQAKVYGETYRNKHRDKINEKNRLRYQENIAENRKKNAEKQKRCRDIKRFKTQTGRIILPLLAAILEHKQGKHD